MTSPCIYKLRVAAAVLLLLLMGIKTVSPVFFNVKNISKAVSSATENNDNDDQKKGSTAAEQDKEVAYISHKPHQHLMWFTPVVHLTAYKNNYHTAYHTEIAIPPPDAHL